MKQTQKENKTTSSMTMMKKEKLEPIPANLEIKVSMEAKDL